MSLKIQKLKQPLLDKTSSLKEYQVYKSFKNNYNLQLPSVDNQMLYKKIDNEDINTIDSLNDIEMNYIKDKKHLSQESTVDSLKEIEMHYIKDKKHLLQEKQKFQEGHDIFNKLLLVPTQKMLYQLPTLVPMESETFIKSQYYQQQLSQVDKQIMEIGQKTAEYLQQNVKQFDINETHNFRFCLPKSIFPEDQTHPLIQYHNQIENVSNCNHCKNELLYKDSLTIEQIAQISQKGTFDVPSIKYQSQKYAWKIHRYIITGTMHIKNFTFQLLYLSLSQLHIIPNYFKQKAKISNNSCNKFCIYNAFRNLLTFFYQTLQLLIGVPLIKKSKLDKKQIFTIIFTRYFESVLQKILRQNKKGKQNLYFWNKQQADKFKKMLAQLETDFYRDVWHQQHAKAIEGTLDHNDKYFLQRLQMQKYIHLEQFIQGYSKFEYNESVRNNLIQYVKAYQIIAQEVFNSIHAEREKYKHYYNLFIAEHPISSKIEEYRTRMLQKLTLRFKQELIGNVKKKTNDQLLNNAEQQLYWLQFQSFLAFQSSVEKEYQNLKKERTQYVPYDAITVTRLLFQPWKVTQTEVPEQQQYQNEQQNLMMFKQIRYHLVKTVIYTVQTDSWFWRVRVFFIRLYAYVHNAIFIIFQQSLMGPVGLRALCGTQKYSSDNKTINTNTGVVSDSSVDNRTVLGAFNSVWSDIQQDRDYFEKQSDTGLFGKKITRVGNLFYNFVFKFGLVAVICVLICFPIIIVCNFVISMLLCVSAVLWVPVFLLIWRVFQIIIYDSDNRRFNNCQDKCDEIVPSQWFPLPAAILMSLIYRFCFQMIYSIIVAFIIQLIISIILFTFAIFYYLFRNILDKLMMIIIRCAARQPATESCIVRKIQFPSINETYNNSYKYIDIEEIYILVNTYLEKIELDFYEKHMRTLIQKPIEVYKSAMAKLLQPLNASLKLNHEGTSEEKMVICEKRLIGQLENALSNRRRKYPTYPQNVRYYKDELDTIIRNTSILIERLINEKQMTYIWAFEGIDENQYVFLSKQILTRILGYSFLEPLETLDKRTILISDKQPHFQKIANYISGDMHVLERHVIDKKIQTQKNHAQTIKMEVPDFVKLSQDVMVYSNPELLGEYYANLFNKSFFKQGEYQCWINALFLIAFADLECGPINTEVCTK